MFDSASLLVNLMVSTVGFALLIYGKKQERRPQLGVGLVMMVYPYFVPSPMAAAAIGVALLVLMVLAIRAGL